MVERADIARKGGRARADALTPSRRIDIAKAAAEARWGKRAPKARMVSVRVRLPEELLLYVEGRCAERRIEVSEWLVIFIEKMRDGKMRPVK